LYAAETREFVQVLEGPRSEVTSLYGRIARDPRHKHVFVLHESMVGNRMFPDWRMGFVATQTQALRTLTGYFPLGAGPAYQRPPGLAVHVSAQLRRFLAEFVIPLATDE
jgi:hypothetical protein